MNILKTIIITTCLTMSLIASHATATELLSSMPAGVYALDKTHASLVWRVSHFGLSNYTARFTKFDAHIHLHAKDFTKSKLTVTIDPRSLTTDYPNPEKTDFDKELTVGKKGKSWFNTDKFPKITFKSTKITKIDEQHATITGNLNFLGKTKLLTLDATLNGAMKKHPHTDNPVIGFSATGTMKRSDWGMKNYVPYIGNDVQLQIEVEFIQ